VLATTREAFGLRVERCYPLQPLRAADSAQLFVGRAQGVAWNANGVPEATARIASLCGRLDGLPLAIELAAGMLGTLSLSDVERQLGEGDTLGLRSGDPTTPSRHRSLLDVIVWGVSLFDASERDSFARLAVFSGSFSAEHAKAICTVDLTTIGKLVAQSVLVRQDAGESRFVFLISVGEYARRLFGVHPQAAAIRDAHAAWYAALAMRSEEPAFWSDERAWLREIDRDFPNFAAALRWSLFEEGSPNSGLRLVLGLTHYFMRRGFFADGLTWVRAALGRAGPDSLERAQLLICLASLEKAFSRFEIALDHARAAASDLSVRGLDRYYGRALNWEAAMLMYMHRTAEASEVLERSLKVAERCGDVRTEGQILGNLAYIASLSDDDGAREMFVQSMKCFTSVGDLGSAARTLDAIAGLDYVAGRYDAANKNLERALEIFRDLGDFEMAAGIITDLGDVAFMRGDARARGYYSEALSMCADHETELILGAVLCGCAALAAQSGRIGDAAQLLGAAQPDAFGAKTPAGQRILEHARSLAIEGLGEREYELEVVFGRGLARKDATRLARSVLA